MNTSGSGLRGYWSPEEEEGGLMEMDMEEEAMYDKRGLMEMQHAERQPRNLSEMDWA